MSATKWLAKQLKVWDESQRDLYRRNLEKRLGEEKNPMIRASLQEQLQMIAKVGPR